MSGWIQRMSMFLLIVCLLTGCKLAVIVGEGGAVESASGTRDCPHSSYCLNAVDDPNFNETFTVVPKPGFEFVKWHGGEGFLCRDSTNVNCTVTLTGDATSTAIVGTYEKAYLMPIFRDVGVDTDGDGTIDREDDDDDNDGVLDVDDVCPLNPEQECAFIDNTVTVNGQIWAQVDLFTGLSWLQIEAVCPAGICAGVLNGYSMNGWRWAGSDDLNALFNHYLGSLLLGPGPDSYLLFGTDNTGIFYSDGWRPTQNDGTYLVTGGYLVDELDMRGSVIFSTSPIAASGWISGDGGFLGGAWFLWDPQ